MKLRDIAGLAGNDLWKAIRGLRKVEHLDWLEARFANDPAKVAFIQERRREIRNQLSLAAQITLNIDALVAHATGCTPKEANAALNELQARAEARANG